MPTRVKAKFGCDSESSEDEAARHSPLTVQLDDAVRLALRVLGQALVRAKIPLRQVVDLERHLGAVERGRAGLLVELELARPAMEQKSDKTCQL